MQTFYDNNETVMIIKSKVQNIEFICTESGHDDNDDDNDDNDE